MQNYLRSAQPTRFDLHDVGEINFRSLHIFVMDLPCEYVREIAFIVPELIRRTKKSFCTRSALLICADPKIDFRFQLVPDIAKSPETDSTAKINSCQLYS